MRGYIESSGFIFKKILFLSHPDITTPTLYFEKENIKLYFRESDKQLSLRVDRGDILNKDVGYNGKCDTVDKFNIILNLLEIKNNG